MKAERFVMKAERTFFPLKALGFDRSFWGSLASSILGAASLLIAVVEWNYLKKIPVVPLTEAIRMSEIEWSVLPERRWSFRPISKITTEEAADGAVWEGYEIRITVLCGKESLRWDESVSETFRKKNAKLVIFPPEQDAAVKNANFVVPPPNEQDVTIADVNFVPDTCDRVNRDQARFARISAVFDDQPSSLGKQLAKRYYVVTRQHLVPPPK